MITTFIRQGRIFAKNETEAVEAIRSRYGDGRLHIRICNVQPKLDLVWYEYTIDVDSTGEPWPAGEDGNHGWV